MNLKKMMIIKLLLFIYELSSSKCQTSKINVKRPVPVGRVLYINYLKLFYSLQMFCVGRYLRITESSLVSHSHTVMYSWVRIFLNVLQHFAAN